MIGPLLFFFWEASGLPGNNSTFMGLLYGFVTVR